MIKVIGFDLDDTLWAVKPVILSAEAALKTYLTECLPNVDFSQECLLTIRKQMLEEDPSFSFKLTVFRQTLLTRAMINGGVEATQARQLASKAMGVFLQARNQVTFYPGTIAALSELAEHYLLCALTNGNADIRILGLDHLFKFSLSAEQVGAAKPDPALFHAAIQRTKIKAHEMIYVGDDPILDIDAAARLGIWTIWKSNPKKQSELITKPDAQIQQGSELPAAVAKIIQLHR